MFLRSCRFGLAVSSVTSIAFALPNGIETSSCNGCHTADVGYEGSISLIPSGTLTPDVETEFTLRIEESHMKEAGFFVYSGGVGTFKAGTGTRASESGVVHSKPATSTDGVVEIKFWWTPPAQADGLDMQVYVVAADHSSSQTGDIAASAIFPLVWGCDGTTLYEDIDGDTYGNDEGAQSIGCGEREGWATNGDDCNDLWVSIHPGAKEVANNKDDDCNGEVDDGVVIGTWYEDADGDGYGEYGTDVDAEAAPEGYVGNNDDCNDSDPNISPEGVEVCDGIDNNCNQELDDGDGVYVVCGVGICGRRWEVCDTECRPGTPMVEVCNGLDDDCDGEVDEAVTCADGSACELGTCPTATTGSTDAAAPSSEPRPTTDASSSGTAAAAGVSTSAPNFDGSDATWTSTTETAATTEGDEDQEGAEDTDRPRENSSPQSSASGGCAVNREAPSIWSWSPWALAILVWQTRRGTRRR